MFVAGYFRAKKKIDKVNTASIYRFIFDWRCEADKNGHGLLQPRKPRMRQSNPLTDPGTTYTLAFLQSRQDI